jgi:hypothetical protein
MNTYFKPCPKVHTKKHSHHISNPKPTAEDYCEFDEGGTVCGLPFAEHHEPLGGPYRNNSIEDELQIMLCRKHHSYVQDSPRATAYRQELEIRMQLKYEEDHTRAEFIRRYTYSRIKE